MRVPRADTRSTVSRRMAAVRQRNTDPEMVLRRELSRIGVRFRVHDGSLPGTPDIVLRGRRVAIFVHGCFWHRHRNCRLATLPKSNVEFWSTKLRENVRRDARNARLLRSVGWTVCTVWECRLRQRALAEARRVSACLRRGGAFAECDKKR